MAEPPSPTGLQTVVDALTALVRPILAYGFGGAIIAFAWTGYLTADAFLGMAAVIIGFYFQARQAEKAEKRIEKQQDAIIELSKSPPSEPPNQPPRTS